MSLFDVHLIRVRKLRFELPKSATWLRAQKAIEDQTSTVLHIKSIYAVYCIYTLNPNTLLKPDVKNQYKMNPHLHRNDFPLSLPSPQLPSMCFYLLSLYRVEND